MNKIDLIIDFCENMANMRIKGSDDALAAARELRELKPVAWVTRGTFSGRFQLCDSDDVGAFQVYALEVTK